jgi:methionyl-tRNA synthetase
MFIQKLDPEKFSQAFGILCQYVYPWQDVVKPPFGSMWCIVGPGQTATSHNHHEGETFIIMEGSGVLTVDGTSAEVTVGDIIYLPPLSMHALRNTSQESTLRFLSVYWEDIALLNEQVARKMEDEQSAAPKRVLVTATPPTPNGDLHLGHLSGPYVAADIYTRYLRMRGSDARYISGADIHQSYVALKGRQIGAAPAATASRFSDAMAQTLHAAEVELDLFAQPSTSEHHIQFVQGFFKKLYEDGKFIVKDADSLFCESCAMYLFEAHVRGKCPHCGAGASGNACEDCGRPNDCIDLVDPTCIHCRNTPSKRVFKRLYFPLSQYHEQLASYFASVNMNMHMRVLCDKMLSDGLPDISISHISDWGIPVPLDEFAGQTLYVWFEMAPGYLSATQEALQAAPGGQEWRRFWQGDDAKVVQFFGFDNGYFHAVLFPALFMAYDPAIKLPATFVTNEFYRLDNLKFSTSRVHAIWGSEFIGPVPSDIVRFYLSYDRPETEQTNFTLSAFKQTVQRELIDSWQPWLQQLKAKVLHEYDGIVPEAGAWLPDHRRFYNSLKQVTEQAMTAYADVTFSPQRVTRLSSELVRTARAFGKAEEYANQVPARQAHRRTGIALELLAAKTLALLIAPIMPHFAQQIAEDLGYQSPLSTWEEVPSMVPGGQRITNADRSYFPELAAMTDALPHLRSKE